MFQNLLLIAFRSLKKRKFYTILNVAGLATSMSFAFLLWLYIEDQHSYDQHYLKGQRIYRVDADYNMNGKRDIYSNVARPVGPTLKDEFPEVEAYVRILGMNGLEVHNTILELEDKRIKAQNAFYADSSIFKIFNREFLSGDPDKALTEPNSIVITESLAEKIFGTKDAFGKTVNQPSDGKLLKVTGVINDEDRNSHLPMEAILSWNTYPRASEMTQWYGAHCYTYILLNETNDPVALHDKFPAYYEKYMKATFDQLNGSANLIFQPLTEIYLSKEYVWEANPHGSRTNVVALSVVIIFLLVFACINYVNLATARAAERAAEVGIRKTLGSPRRYLLGQFISESVVLALFSGLMSLLISALLLTPFNKLADLHLTVTGLLSLQNFIYVLALSLAIGLLAGIYPAFYLSSLESIQVLKGKFSASGRGEVLRRVLVTSQYFIAATLIASILFVAEQTRFIKNRDIGFNKNNIVNVIVPKDTVVSRHVMAFTNRLKQSPRIIGTTSSHYSLSQEANHFTPTLENPDGTTFQMGTDLLQVDYDFVETIGATFTAGHNFLPNSDEQLSILINEAAVKQFGWTANPLGGKFVGFAQEGQAPPKLNVVGVVKDFNLGVSYHMVNPIIMFLDPRGGANLYIRIKDGETIAGMEDIRKTWKEVFPDFDLEYSFLDQSLNDLYIKEEKFLNLLTSFSFIIVFIASLGIIGLISFTTELRKKEIAVRKVLGSPIQDIIMLLSKKFVALLMIANLIAIPATWFLVNLWLDNFAYKIVMGPWPFIISLAVCSFFTALSVLYHTSQAAKANPVDALSYE